MVTGKGGTGKSTCASAIAVLAARRGLRPLLLEVESVSTARSIFGIKRAGVLPKRTPVGVDVVSVGFQTGIEELVHDVMKVPRVVRVLLRHPVISRFLRATPSALDFAALFLTQRYMNATNSEGQPEHHLIVLDMPAFGHARQMLSVGKNVAELLRVGPIATRGVQIDTMVHDHDTASIVVVTLPEEMPVTETVEGYRALQDDLEVPVGPVLVNCNHPERLNRDEAGLGPGDGRRRRGRWRRPGRLCPASRCGALGLGLGARGPRRDAQARAPRRESGPGAALRGGRGWNDPDRERGPRPREGRDGGRRWSHLKPSNVSD